jgi:hypothetical protein
MLNLPVPKEHKSTYSEPLRISELRLFALLPPDATTSIHVVAVIY